MNGWSRETTIRAAEMWRRGDSAGVISAALGVSRSAVIARLRRLGVTRAVRDPSASLRPPAKPRKPKTAQRPKPSPLWLSFAELPARACRYPNEFDGETRFCAAPTPWGSRYCAAHRALVYVSREVAR